MKMLIVLAVIFLNAFSVIAQKDEVLYSFETKNKKVVQLLYNKADSVFTYRFLSKGKVELEVRDNLRDHDTVFTVDGYHRGGGIDNAGMDYNDVFFSHGGYGYDVYYNWAASEDVPDAENDAQFGVNVLKDGQTIADIKGTKIIEGGIGGWSFTDILPQVKKE